MPYLFAARIKEIFQFDDVAVLQSAHDLKFAILQGEKKTFKKKKTGVKGIVKSFLMQSSLPRLYVQV